MPSGMATKRTTYLNCRKDFPCESVQQKTQCLPKIMQLWEKNKTKHARAVMCQVFIKGC